MADSTLTEHIVKAGECVASIAAACRDTVESLWDLAANAELRKLRVDPFVLAPGDRLMVPKPKPAAFVLEAGKRHVFRRHGTHVNFQVTVTLNDKPRANIDFTLVVDGDKTKPITGQTDDGGVVRTQIPAAAQRGRIEFADGLCSFGFELGDLDPLDTIAGVQGRLRNLGFFFARVDGVYGPYTASALRKFQRAHRLEPTGLADDPTKAALRSAYGR